MSIRRSMSAPWWRNAASLALLAILGCVSVGYQRASQPVTAKEGKTLVIGRLRFFHDDDEFFPWSPELFADSSTERHVWLLRLTGRAVSPEVHPDADGSLALWLASGDYAILGSRVIRTDGVPPYEIAGLLRVPAGPIATYAGELIMKTRNVEGWHASYGDLGEKSVVMAPMDSVRATFERRYGPLPEEPVLSPWCVGDQVPDFDDPALATRATELLDHGCPARRSVRSP